MSKILITGGSGFIGSNLVEYLSSKKHTVLNFDIKPPRNKKFQNTWVEGNILEKDVLEKCVSEFNPDYVVHLAARTDLNETKNIDGYKSNIQGVYNIVEIINNQKTIKRAIYASSRMVCEINYVPIHFDDYCPPNLYGESKMIGEQYVKVNARHDFIVVRPTSIWGPWFEIPYRTFFDTINKGLFFLPEGHNPKKSFGFVLNTVYQLEKMLFAEKSDLEECYYLTDYPALELNEWSNLIAADFNKKSLKKIPMSILRVIAFSGDYLTKLGWKNPPLTSFRLNNLITNMVYNTNSLEKLCGNLPYSIKEGVDLTTKWMKNN